MKKLSSFLILIILTTVIVLGGGKIGLTYAFSDVFLSLGDKNTSVKQLQQWLNQDSVTRLAVSGPGSSGQETNYYGPLTEAAVRRFQRQQATYILKPQGLFNPTGMVDILTWNRLKTVFGDQQVVNRSNSIEIVPPKPLEEEVVSKSNKELSDNTKTKSSSSVSKKIILNNLEPTFGSPGTKVRVYGKNLTAEPVIVHTTFFSLPAQETSDDYLSFPIDLPWAADIESIDKKHLVGIDRPEKIPMWVYVENSAGFSNALEFDLIID
ncbi:MAG: peptidoglycan-binding domain-containing protein [Patescibacteria group bacterium]